EGEVVAHILLYRRPHDLRVPRDSIDLGAASTLPAARGSGAGRALTEPVLPWAHETGYPTMVTDWRMTNLLASRFWPKRGFRPTFLRLYRALP
ncbi:MAG: GNAT family N-acetyltransferase, partial [Gaiellaceae bacterium]